MNAKKVLKQLLYVELIAFEQHDSHWLKIFEISLKQFRKINSKPKYLMPIRDDKNDYILWLVNSLYFFKDKEEWLILVPNCTQPVWANVRVLDFTKALEELWKTSESRSFIIADKSTGLIAQIYSEEQHYEIHVDKCDISSINNKNDK
ncbi:hypothetical protein GRQ40_04735 [Anoxybacillus sp. PDR2]|nr:hypothetical protein GRQ40_04735 [Anoxybacillus sp. PDR2]